jgi:hypothetical protein
MINRGLRAGSRGGCRAVIAAGAIQIVACTVRRHGSHLSGLIQWITDFIKWNLRPRDGASACWVDTLSSGFPWQCTWKDDSKYLFFEVPVLSKYCDVGARTAGSLDGQLIQHTATSNAPSVLLVNRNILGQQHPTSVAYIIPLTWINSNEPF